MLKVYCCTDTIASFTRVCNAMRPIAGDIEARPNLQLAKVGNVQQPKDPSRVRQCGVYSVDEQSFLVSMKLIAPAGANPTGTLDRFNSCTLCKFDEKSAHCRLSRAHLLPFRLERGDPRRREFLLHPLGDSLIKHHE